MRLRVLRVFLAVVLLFSGGGVLAGTQAVAQMPATASTDRLAALEKQAGDNATAIAAAQTAGDNGWMLVSAALVLMMSGPGLALFYGGLVRKKNVLGTMMQTFAMMAVVTVLWALVTYSLAFGDGQCVHRRVAQCVSAWRGAAAGQGLCGDDSAADLHGVSADVCDYYAGADYGRVCGADEVFGDAGVHGAVGDLVYSPMAHMVWGKGGLLNASLGGRFPCLDFAGGTVVHVTSGVSALVTALYLGKRLGYPKVPMPPHSVVLSFIGACLLWVGWFGFNAGSALCGGNAGDLGVCGDALWRGGGGDWLERGGVDSRMASLRRWERSRARWRGWWRLRRRRDL